MDSHLRAGLGLTGLCRSHFVLPATDWLLGSPPRPRGSPFVPADLPTSEGAFPGVGLFLTFSSPPGGQVLSGFLSSCFSLLLSFILPGYMGILLVFLGVRGPLLMFSRCSVRIVPFVDVFLMCLLGEMNSHPLTPPPSWKVCYIPGIVHDTWEPTAIQTDNDARPCGPCIVSRV